ncbi:carboxypeptidase-like regulatory domain-containing protein [Aquimarina sp. MMG016]|uniref:FEKKY domain-containing protein n=1 Tax=Aquimarina sp. MMG016 TaxID=2822690 RepID=UPI001B39D9DC|nr:carboxypeptidase-like regulatory domain-containing protein [Aquimarina sp. MMG016]MBQ4818612.1 carboxypeptidase-like regulatory domain-containing protein [Aquimarina sp. MMG016]
MKKLFLTILFLHSIIGFSQNEKENEVLIKGIVLSEVNGNPLKNVFIMVNSTGGITNENGRFKLNYKPRKNDSLIKISFSDLGYKTVEKIIDVRKVTEQNFDIVLKPRFGVNRQQALDHIKIGEINILLSGGIAPVIYQSDEKFSKKYKLKFVEFGCEAVSEESLYEYNKIVFEYLDKKYGKKWRKEIREDVIGLKK